MARQQLRHLFLEKSKKTATEKILRAAARECN